MPHSVPVQNELASLASQTAAPRSSSGRPIFPRGCSAAHRSPTSGFCARNCPVILRGSRIEGRIRIQHHRPNRSVSILLTDGSPVEVCTYFVLMYAGLIVFTRMRCGPSSHAMLRAIWSTADLEVLYDTHSWPCWDLECCQSSIPW